MTAVKDSMVFFDPFPNVLSSEIFQKSFEQKNLKLSSKSLHFEGGGASRPNRKKVTFRLYVDPSIIVLY